MFDYSFLPCEYISADSIYLFASSADFCQAKYDKAKVVQIALGLGNFDKGISVAYSAINEHKSVQISISSELYTNACLAVNQINLLSGEKLMDLFEDHGYLLINARRHHKYIHILLQERLFTCFIAEWKWIEEKETYVYIIKASGLNQVKIGYSENPEKRLLQLQTGSSQSLELLLKIPATADDEKMLHRKFASYRTTGEWFNFDGDLARWVIGSNNSGEKNYASS
jgi:hypothetical protein